MYMNLRAVKMEKGKRIRGALYGYTMGTLLLLGLLLVVLINYFDKSSFLSSIKLFIAPFFILMISNFLIIMLLYKARGESKVKNIFALYFRLLKKLIFVNCLIVGVGLAVLLSLQYILGLINNNLIVINLDIILFIFVAVFLLIANIVVVLYISDGFSVKVSLKNTFDLINGNRQNILLEIVKLLIFLILLAYVVKLASLLLISWEEPKYSFSIFVLIEFLFKLLRYHMLLYFIFLLILFIVMSYYLVPDIILSLICLYEVGNLQE